MPDYVHVINVRIIIIIIIYSQNSKLTFLNNHLQDLYLELAGKSVVELLLSVTFLTNFMAKALRVDICYSVFFELDAGKNLTW